MVVGLLGISKNEEGGVSLGGADSWFPLSVRKIYCLYLVFESWACFKSSLAELPRVFLESRVRASIGQASVREAPVRRWLSGVVRNRPQGGSTSASRGLPGGHPEPQPPAGGVRGSSGNVQTIRGSSGNVQTA